MRTQTLLALVAVAGYLAVGCATAPVPTYSAHSTPTANKPLPQATRKPTATLPPPPAVKPQVLRINLGTRPDTLDPQKASNPSSIAVLQLAYEGVTRLDGQGHVLPGAAETWEFAPDGKTLTFHLREGLQRADGTRLTAFDFEYAFKHAVDPRVAGPDESFMDDIHGALAAYTTAPKAKSEDIQRVIDAVGVKATDSTTLVMTFDQPAGYWPTIASTWIGWPSDRAKVEANPDAWWMTPESHNGNGPFTIVAIQEDAIKLEANPNYWGGRPRLDRIEFYWIDDSAAALELYRKGELDMTRVEPDALPQVRSAPALVQDLITSPAAQVAYLGFNMKRAPFTDKGVRKAFSEALDRDALVRDILKSSGKPYLSWIPPGFPGYDETATVPGYDPRAAVQTLVDSGYGTPDKKKVDCNRLGTLKLSFSNTPRHQTIFQAIGGTLMRVFACPVLLEPVDPGTYDILLRDPRTAPPILFFSWQAEYAHPQDWLFLQACNGVFAKRIGYCSKDYDAALASANQELDMETALDRYRAAQKVFVSDVPAAFLWYNEDAFLVKPYVLGIEQRSSLDTAWPGQTGPVLSYGIDLSRVGTGYPLQ